VKRERRVYIAMIDRMVRLPEPDQHVLNVLRELRTGLLGALRRAGGAPRGSM